MGSPSIVERHNSQAQQLTSLIAWFKSNRLTWDESLLDIRGNAQGCGGAALGVFAKRDIAEGDVICDIPKASIISVKTCAIADVLESEKIAGGLGLTIALMHEHLLGPASRWFGYLQSLPVPEYLPIFWTQEELHMLQGTDCERRSENDWELTRQDYEEVVVPLCKEHTTRFNREKMTLELFRVASSWVASRAFGVDSFHGMSMVPFADLFNHKAAIVDLAEGYAIEAGEAGEDESEGGSDEEGDGEESPARSPPSDTAGDDGVPAGTTAESDDTDEEEGGSLCGGDAEKEDGEEETRSGIRRHELLLPAWLEGRDVRLEIGICGTSKDGEDYLQIVAASPVKAGDEVHNTYGELGNADLLAKYGFALPDNPFSSVLMSKVHLLACAEDQLGVEGLRCRREFLDEHSNLLEEDEEPFELLPGGVVGPALLAALRVLFANDAEFASWQTLTDAFTPPAAVLGPESSHRGVKRPADDPTVNVPKKRASTRGNDMPVANGSRGGDEANGHGCEAKPNRMDRLPEGMDGGDADVPENISREGGPSDTEIISREGGPDDAAGDTDVLDIKSLKLGEAGDRGWMLTKGMLVGLRTAINKRLEGYPTGSAADDDREELERLKSVGSRMPAALARIGALTLVVCEKDILWDALTASTTLLQDL